MHHFFGKDSRHTLALRASAVIVSGILLFGGISGIHEAQNPEEAHRSPANPATFGVVYASSPATGYVQVRR